MTVQFNLYLYTIIMKNFRSTKVHILCSLPSKQLDQYFLIYCRKACTQVVHFVLFIVKIEIIFHAYTWSL